MSQKLPVNKFEWKIFLNLMKISIYIYIYCDERYFLEIGDVRYPEKIHEIQNDLPFLPERMKFEKVEKLVTNLHIK